MARWIGAAPRQRGSSDACAFQQPWHDGILPAPCAAGSDRRRRRSSRSGARPLPSDRSRPAGGNSRVARRPRQSACAACPTGLARSDRPRPAGQVGLRIPPRQFPHIVAPACQCRCRDGGFQRSGELFQAQWAVSLSIGRTIGRTWRSNADCCRAVTPGMRSVHAGQRASRRKRRSTPGLCGCEAKDADRAFVTRKKFRVQPLCPRRVSGQFAALALRARCCRGSPLAGMRGAGYSSLRLQAGSRLSGDG